MASRKPLKRHPALVELSRDHHGGLLLCWKIRMGLKNEVEPSRIKDYVLYFFREHLQDHFKWEEELVFCHLPEDDSLRKKAESQHRKLRKRMDELDDKPERISTILGAIEEEVEGHIRFEERELFAHMQDQLPEENLESIQIALEKVHKPFEDHWDDPFWSAGNKN